MATARKAALWLLVPALFTPGCGKDSPSPEGSDQSAPSAAEEGTAISDPNGASALPGTPAPLSPQPISSEAAVLMPPEPKPAPKTDHLSGGYGEARSALETFLETSDWRERLALCYLSSLSPEQAEKQHTSRPDPPIEEYHLRFLSMDETPGDGDFPIYVFTLHIAAEQKEFPVTVRKTPDGMKVDWEIFTEFRSQKFRRFIDSGSSGPEILRVILQRQSYWGEDKEAMASHLSYKLTTMDPEAELLAFVPADSPLVDPMNEFYGWGVGPIAATVVIEKKDFPHGQSHFVITRLATHPLAGDGWHIRP